MPSKKIWSSLFCAVLFYSGKCQTSDTLISVGTYSLHFTIIKGKGIPVLFESGNGDDGTVWKELLAELHDSTGATLITYDRAGLGLSGIDTTSISLLNEVKSLETALGKLGYSKNIFLVCHSFGSYYSTLYAERNKKAVKGAVFIDILSPCYFTKERAKSTKESVSREDWVLLKKEAIGLYYVLKNLEGIYEFTKDKRFPADIPSTVIGADIPPGIVKENEQAEWKECLKSFGTQANHRYIFAKGCRHKVWKDNPTLVADAIVKQYRQVAKPSN